MDQQLEALLDQFLSHARAEPSNTKVERAALAAALTEAIGEARRAWPAVSVADETFVVYLAERTGAVAAGSPQAALERLRTSDLYLACGCANQLGPALEIFERDFIPAIDPALRQLGATPTMLEDVKQHLRDSLLVPDGERPAGIANYAGRGQLRGWLRSAAVRTAFKMMRTDARAPQSSDDEAELLLGADDDPQTLYMKERYAAELKQALVDALALLSARERTLLKQSYIDGLTIDRIGALYRVHRATAARWIARAREVLFEETRALLIERLELTATEFGSVVRLVQSQLDVSIARLLDSPA